MERATLPLARLMEADYVPESNVRGRLSRADARYLLPALDSGTTLHLGLPAGMDAAGFVERSGGGGPARLVTADPRTAETVREAWEEWAAAGLAGELEVVVVSGWDRLPVAAASIDQIVIGGGAGAPSPADLPVLAPELARVATPEGGVALEAVGYRRAHRAEALAGILDEAGFRTDATLWVLSLAGSIRMAVEAGDLGSARRILTWLGRGTSLRRGALRLGVSLLDRLGLLGPFLARRRLFLFRREESAGSNGTEPGGTGSGADLGGTASGEDLGGAAPGADLGRAAPGAGLGRAAPGEELGSADLGEEDPGHEEAEWSHGRGRIPTLWPPPYLRSVLREAGLDPGRYRCGFHVHGRYDSNKVAFFLFDRRGTGAGQVVKSTRASRFNHRLENEYRSLSLVEEHGYLPPRAYPERTVFAYRGGLAMLGLRFVPGRPMREVTTADDECRFVRQVVDHLEALAAASARGHADEPDVAGSLRDRIEALHDRFEALYPLEPAEARFLRRQVEILRDHVPDLPLVFQHGDAGIWNVMVDGEDAVLLDWEAAEPAGMPLWDLFYFLRSVGSWNSRTRGDEDLVRSYETHFLAPTALARFQARVVEQYRRRLGMAEEVVDPLFYTGWMHRALREAMQLAPDQLFGGTYVRLLRSCIRIRGLEEGKAP